MMSGQSIRPQNSKSPGDENPNGSPNALLNATLCNPEPYKASWGLGVLGFLWASRV